jgi:hypothetical protein
VGAFEHYCKLGHFRDVIDGFRQFLSCNGFVNLLWIRIQDFKTYVLAVTSQALLFYVIAQSKLAPNS